VRPMPSLGQFAGEIVVQFRGMELPGLRVILA
jgi:hypothetical protein